MLRPTGGAGGDMGTKAGSGATKKAQALTAKIIEALKADPAGPYRVPDSRTRGLALRVAVDGGRTWDLVFRIKGAGVRRPSLGRYEDVGMEAARDRANEITSAARQGRDLIAEEKAERDEYDRSFTVERLIDEYAKRRLTGRLRSAATTERLIRQTLAPVMTRKALDIRRRDLRQLLDEVADRGMPRRHRKAPHARANNVPLGLATGHRRNRPLRRTQSLRTGDRARARADRDEIRALWEWLESRECPPHIADVLKVQLCLGARVGEVAGMIGARIRARTPQGGSCGACPPAGARTAGRGSRPF